MPRTANVDLRQAEIDAVDTFRKSFQVFERPISAETTT